MKETKGGHRWEEKENGARSESVGGGGGERSGREKGEKREDRG